MSAGHSISATHCVLTFAGILVTEATAVPQPWNSCYHILWPIPKTWRDKTSDDVDDGEEDEVDHGAPLIYLTACGHLKSDQSR